MNHNVLTIDFEDWYQGLTSTSKHPQQWCRYEQRLQIGGNWLLDTLAESDVQATFFIVGQVARDHPELVRRVAEAGHEIALHGDMHQRVDTMPRGQFRSDLSTSIEAVRQASGAEPVAFRAPCFSVGPDNEWLWEELAARGIRLDSSVFPIRTPLYGMPDAPRDPFMKETSSGTVRECPVTTIRLLGTNLPFSGGFYFRVLPYPLVRGLTRHLNRRGRGVMFYFHPWEFDAEHPRPPSVTVRERVSHYGWLRGARQKFVRLLNDFRFASLGDAV